MYYVDLFPNKDIKLNYTNNAVSAPAIIARFLNVYSRT